MYQPIGIQDTSKRGDWNVLRHGHDVRKEKEKPGNMVPVPVCLGAGMRQALAYSVQPVTNLDREVTSGRKYDDEYAVVSGNPPAKTTSPALWNEGLVYVCSFLKNLCVLNAC